MKHEYTEAERQVLRRIGSKGGQAKVPKGFAKMELDKIQQAANKSHIRRMFNKIRKDLDLN